jgi:iron(III) transport system permease protein
MAGAAVLRRAPEKIDGLESATAPFRLGAWRWPAEAVLWFVIVAVVILPTLSLLAAALVPTYGVTLSLSTFTLDKFVEVLWRQPLTLRALRNSTGLAMTAAAVLIALAIPLAYTLSRRAGRLRDAAEALLEIPYALPGIVLAIACILLFLRPLPLIGVSIYATPWIILFAYLARFLPMALKPSLAAMSQLSQESDEAATSLGASFLQRMRRIVIPAILPSAAAGGMMVFLTAFNELTVSALLWSAGTETLGVALFNLEDAGLASEAAAVALCATAVIALAMLVLQAFSARLPDGVLPWKI